MAKTIENTSGEVQFSRIVNLLNTALLTNQWKSMKAHMIRKMSDVIQKQRNQSLNLQNQSFKVVFIKRCSEICSKFTGEHLCRSVISM